MQEQERIEKQVAEQTMELPIEFKVKYTTTKTKRKFWFFSKKEEIETERKFFIYPPTLGKLEYLSKLFLELDFNDKALKDNPFNECLRICSDKTDLICNIMAVATTTSNLTKKNDELKKKALFFKQYCTTDNFIDLMYLLFQCLHFENFTTSIRLTKIFRINNPTTKRTKRVE